MDSWLRQEALKNPDIKRLAHEERTSGNKSAHLQTFVCSERCGAAAAGPCRAPLPGLERDRARLAPSSAHGE